MKKILFTAILLSSVTWANAKAQSYNPNYPSNVPSSYTGYAAKKNSANDGLKKFSIGFDYIIGTAGIVDEDISIESPLPGGDVYKTRTSNFDDGVDSLNGNIGFRPFRYFGVEAFYQKSLENNEVQHRESYALDTRFAQVEYNLKYEAYGIDALAYIPVASWLELLGSFGIANYDFKASLDFNAYSESTLNMINAVPYKVNESKTALRYGAGAQIWLSKRLAFRAMYRYADIGGTFIDDISEISLGVRYNF